MRLVAGPYPLPSIKPGDKAQCRVAGEVVCGGLVDCRIGPWPRRRKTGKPSLIVCGSLVRALKHESELAIVHWWGASVVTVWKWRRALGIGRVTKGTSELLSGNADGWRETDECRAVLTANARDEQNRAASADRKRGKPASAATKAALLRAAKKRKTKKHRENIGRALKAIGAHPPVERPWTEKEEALLGATLDRHVAKMIGRTVAAVRARRRQLGIPMSRHARLRMQAFKRGEIQPKRE